MPQATPRSRVLSVQEPEPLTRVRGELVQPRHLDFPVCRVHIPGSTPNGAIPDVAKRSQQSRADLALVDRHQRTVTVTSWWSVSPPSVAITRTTYEPGSSKVTVTGNLPSAGSSGASHPGDHGELLSSR